jgi:hypothetical protein
MNNPDATVKAEKLLYEWMERFLVTIKDGCNAKVDRDASMKKKWMIRTINEIARTVKDEGEAVESVNSLIIPPPTAKDYINLLRAHSISKAKRKGEQAESILVNMMKLANVMANSVDGRSKIWVVDNIPNSKMFALAIKCYAGSTRELILCTCGVYIMLLFSHLTVLTNS